MSGADERGPGARPPLSRDWAPAFAGEQGFVDVAARLAGLAGVAFGWRPDEFWRATPEELAGLVRALKGDAAEPVDARAMARLQELFPDG